MHRDRAQSPRDAVQVYRVPGVHTAGELVMPSGEGYVTQTVGTQLCTFGNIHEKAVDTGLEGDEVTTNWLASLVVYVPYAVRYTGNSTKCCNHSK